eukprot:363132-Chlamydomonas_euryale.AAC.2
MGRMLMRSSAHVLGCALLYSAHMCMALLGGLDGGGGARIADDWEQRPPKYSWQNGMRVVALSDCWSSQTAGLHACCWL